jgi:energy-coupling factor transporter ATP-binding protein EcfA2
MRNDLIGARHHGVVRLRPEEPAAGPWRTTRVALLPGLLGHPTVLGVDGRAGSGKSTFAECLAGVVPGATVVHTDDIAWYESFFDWEHLLVDGVLEPARRGLAVAFRPPAWEERGRRGAIVVPEGCSLLVVEGVGVGRRSLAGYLDGLVWVQSDADVARRRGIERDIAKGEEDPVAFWEEWQAEEVPLLARERPWERAGLVVAGTPDLPHDEVVDVGDVVVAPPMSSPSGLSRAQSP